MRTRALSITLCPQLITLIASPTDTPTHRSRISRMLANTSPRIRKRTAHNLHSRTRLRQRLSSTRFVILFDKIAAVVIAVGVVHSDLARETQLLQGVMRALGKSVQAGCLRQLCHFNEIESDNRKFLTEVHVTGLLSVI